MHFTSFIKYLEVFGELSAHLTTELRNRCEPFDLPDRTMLIEPDKSSKFIHEGLLRTFQVGEGEQHTMRFSGANEFIADGQGFLFKKFSGMGVVTHSKASGIKIRTNDW